MALISGLAATAQGFMFKGDVSKVEFPFEEVIDCNNKAG